MKLCTNCGYRNPELSKYCMQCGHDLVMQRPATTCPHCGASNTPFSDFCETCGKWMSLDRPQPVQPVVPQILAAPLDEPVSSPDMIKSEGKLFWAGLLMILGGISDVGSGVWTLFMDIPSNDLGIDLSGYIAFCGTFVVILGLGAILGGFVSFTRKYFFLAITGAIMGMLGVGVFYTGSIACLIALILVAISKDDFQY